MKVWIDQDLCTGDGLCEEIAPDVFTLLDDGLAYVKEGPKIFAAAKSNAQGAEGLAEIPDGQLDAVIRMLEEGRDCEEVVTQLAAVSKALDRAGFAIVSSGLQQCLTQSGNLDSIDAKKIEKLFLSLA